MAEANPQTTSTPLAAPSPTQLAPEQLNHRDAAAAQPYALYPAAYGQPFQPYTGQPPAEALQPPPNRAWEVAKMVLHCLGMVLAICGLGLGFSLINESDSGFYIVSIGNCIPLGIAFLWSLAEMITRAVRKFKAGIHPGAHVGMSLIIWLMAVIVGVMFSIWATLGIAADCYEAYTYSATGYTYESDCPDYTSQFRITKATVAFTDMVALLYFGLFIGACIDTHKHNKAKAAKPIMIVAHPQPWAVVTQGWQPMQQTAGPVPQQTVPPQTQSPDSNGDSAVQGTGKEPEVSHRVVEHYAPGGSSQV